MAERPQKKVCETEILVYGHILERLLSQQTLDGEFELDYRIRQSNKIIETILAKTKTPLLINFSGGKDSTILLDLVQNVTDNFICCYMSTEIELPKNIDYVREACEKRGCQLLVSTPSEHKGDFFSRLAKFKIFPTFSAPWCTRDLKIRPQRKMLNRLYGKKTFFKLTGVRRAESSRRTKIYKSYKLEGFIQNEYQYGGRDQLIHPILYWSDENIIEYLRREKIRVKTNPLYEKFGVSGCAWCYFYQSCIYEKILAEYPNLYDHFIEWEKKLNTPSVSGYIWLKDLKNALS